MRANEIVASVEASGPFRKSYQRLSPTTRGQVERTIRRLATGEVTPGLGIEKVRGASDNVRSCRVTRGIRMIYEIVDGGLRLLYVGNHDVAYRAAAYFFVTGPLLDEETPAGDLGEFELFTERADSSLLEDLNDLLRAANLSESATPGLRELASSIRALIEQAVSDGTERKAKPFESGDHAAINVIPSRGVGSCRDVLVAFCFDGDSFDDRLTEVAYHAGIHCLNTRLVVLVTSQWDAKKWKTKHEEAYADLTSIVVVYLSAFGQLTRVG